MNKVNLMTMIKIVLLQLQQFNNIKSYNNKLKMI